MIDGKREIDRKGERERVRESEIEEQEEEEDVRKRLSMNASKRYKIGSMIKI